MYFAFLISFSKTLFNYIFYLYIYYLKFDFSMISPDCSSLILWIQCQWLDNWNHLNLRSTTTFGWSFKSERRLYLYQLNLRDFFSSVKCLTSQFLMRMVIEGQLKKLYCLNFSLKVESSFIFLSRMLCNAWYSNRICRLCFWLRF